MPPRHGCWCGLLSLASILLLVVGLGWAQEAISPRPLGPLPPVPIPPDNPMSPAKVELGKLLFFDTRLSGDGAVSCASCHDPKQGWGDAGDISRGYPGTQHWRNAQTILNAAYLQKLFWDGSVSSLERQAPAAATGNVAGNGDPMMMEERLRAIPEYVQRFRDVFGTPPSINDAWKAIAAFERTLVSRHVPFDRSMRGEQGALSEDAGRGLELFQGKAQCLQCHHGPLFSDESFHNLGVPLNPVFQENPLYQITFRYEQKIKGVPEQVYRTADRDYGLYYITKRVEDKGKFRTPTLREVTRTAPYMHNGVFFTLEEVIDFYNLGGGDDPNKSPLLKPLHLTDPEKKALLAFLESLSGEEILVEPPTLPPYEVLK